MSENNGHFEHLQVPSNSDLERVRELLQHEAFLVEQLIQTREALVEAWKIVPHDPELTKKPWRSDIAHACRNCGRPTKWVSPKGYNLHYIVKDKDIVAECPPNKLGKTTEGIDPKIWELLDMPDEMFEGDMEETLEIITRTRDIQRAVENDTKKPSEREN